MAGIPGRAGVRSGLKSLLFLAASPLTPLFELLRQLDGHLKQLGTRWALVGGLAVGARTDPRFTRDVDIAVAVDNDAEAEKLVNFLLGRGFRLGALLEQTAVDRLATVRLLAPDSNRLADILFASSGIESEVVEQAEELEIASGCSVPVARSGHLIAMKVLARNDRIRPQDRLDLSALLGVSDAHEMDLCRQAIGLIVDRKFHRGRPLADELEAALREFGPAGLSDDGTV